MTLTIIAASALVFSWKLFGWLVPEKLITDSVRQISERITIALLAGLVVMQSVTSSGAWQFDARLPALAVGALLLVLRAPFIAVVLAAGATATLIRALGF